MPNERLVNRKVDAVDNFLITENFVRIIQT